MEFLCLEFINSQWYNTHELYLEPLKDNQWLQGFLKRWNLTIDEEITKVQINQLLELRSQLKGLIEKIMQKQSFSATEINWLNTYLALSTVKHQLSYQNQTYTIQLIPLIKDFNWLVGQIVISFARVLTEYDPQRIKRCQNAACQWIFFDESKNRSRRWCDSTCGNLMKVRRFREREKKRHRFPDD